MSEGMEPYIQDALAYKPHDLRCISYLKVSDDPWIAEVIKFVAGVDPEHRSYGCIYIAPDADGITVGIGDDDLYFNIDLPSALEYWMDHVVDNDDLDQLLQVEALAERLTQVAIRSRQRYTAKRDE